jgi:hypothetical protein
LLVFAPAFGVAPDVTYSNTLSFAATLKISAGFTVVVKPAADDLRCNDAKDKLGSSGVATTFRLVAWLKTG